MTAAPITQIDLRDQATEDPPPIELPGLGTIDENHGCCSFCWCILSWVASLVFYTVECFVTVWVVYTYASQHLFVPFGLCLGYLTLTQVVVVTISLIWYYSLDRFHRKRKESDPHNLAFIDYRKKFSPAAIIFHIFLLGMVYRYAQVIYLVMIRKTGNLPYLRRDTTYLRFIHSLLMSAPLIVLHLYILFLHLPTCLDITDSQCAILDNPAVWVGLGASLTSLLYSTLAFTTNDRLSGKRRRVILPAHITQTLWYVCVLTSRLLAMVLFTHAYGFYIFPFVGAHWIFMFVFLLLQRTTFCADVIRETPSEVRIRRRWCLEIPFLFVAATMYIFTYVNIGRGKTRYWMLFFHLLMYAEIATMSALYYVNFAVDQYYVFSLTALTSTLGLYPVGLLFMLTFYLFFHPGKTEGWYWIGIPKRNGDNKDMRRDVTQSGFQKHSSTGDRNVMISGPTLVAHNGFIPHTMLPYGTSSSPDAENGMVTNQNTMSQSYSNSFQQRESSSRLIHDWNNPRAVAHQDLVSSLTLASPNIAAGHMVHPTTTPSESLPPLSDIQSQTGPSDMDTENEFRRSPQFSVGDNVIDTPLFGTTPDPEQQRRICLENFAGSPTYMEAARSHTDTVNTGVDLDADRVHEENGLPQDHGLHQDHGTSGEYHPIKPSRDVRSSSLEHREMEGSTDLTLHQFKDIPAKSRSYLRKKSPLESHYFPEKSRRKHSRESLTPTLPTPTWGQTPPYHSPSSNHRALQNSSGESGELFHPTVKMTMLSDPGVTSQQQHHVLPLKISTPERSKRHSAPRSPKGARAFTIVPQGEGQVQALIKNPVNHSSSYPGSQGLPPNEFQSHYSPQRPKAPRSPKGAKRMLVVQPGSSKPKTPAAAPHHMPVPLRSPEQLPKGVSNYQRQQLSSSLKSAVKSPEKLNRNNTPMHKSFNSHVDTSLRSPERSQKDVRVYKRDAPSSQQRQYIQQQQQNRSRWDKWAAEQEEKRRQVNSITGDTLSNASGGGVQRNNSFTPSYGSGPSQSSYNSPKHKVEKSQSQPSHSIKHSNVNQATLSQEEFDHLSPTSATLDSCYNSSQHETLTDKSSYPEGASIAPQAYPRAPQGAKGRGPRMAWSPSQNRTKISPQRSIQSMSGGSPLKKESTDMGLLSASCQISRVPSTREHSDNVHSRPLRMSRNMSSINGSGSIYFYVPTNSSHQSVV